jgi:hypothetical protein
VNKINTDSIFTIQREDEFEKIALNIFQFQVNNCTVYADFVRNLAIDPAQVSAIGDIPFLPIEFFKNHRVISKQTKPAITFTSSGTTSLNQSTHIITDLSIYERSFNKSFELVYNHVQDLAIIALLPSYLERQGSSLIYMVDAFIHQSKYPQSGYFLYNHTELVATLNDLKDQNIPTLLIGVTYALLDFIEAHQLNFPKLIVMETGGMKGRKKELVRKELHQILCKGFGVEHIHSEYGMTELLSQAYSRGSGLFHCPPWMQVYVRDINDPLTILPHTQTGGINVIDLANIYSCSFIATQDLGKLHTKNCFEVLGRFDASDVRGCNLLIQ